MDAGISIDLSVTEFKYIGELYGNIYDFDFDFPALKQWWLPDITIQHFIDLGLEYKGFVLSLGTGVTLSSLGRFNSVGKVLGFKADDVIYFVNQTRKFVDRVKQLIENKQYVFFPFFNMIETNYSDKYMLDLYVFNQNQNTKNVIAQIQDGTLNIEPISHERYILIEFINVYNDGKVYFKKTKFVKEPKNEK